MSSVCPSNLGCTWIVGRALRWLEMVSAAPRESLRLFSCSPNYPRASRIGWTQARHCPFLKNFWVILQRSFDIFNFYQFKAIQVAAYHRIILRWSRLPRNVSTTAYLIKLTDTGLQPALERFVTKMLLLTQAGTALWEALVYSCQTVALGMPSVIQRCLAGSMEVILQ